MGRRIPKYKTKSNATIEKLRRAKYGKILSDPALHKTWSSRMPPYCFTELCPDARFRPENMREVMSCERNVTPVYAGHA